MTERAPCTHPDHQGQPEPAVARLSHPGERPRPNVPVCLPHLLEAVEHCYGEADIGPAYVEPIGSEDPAAPEIDARVASHVLWHYGELGYEPGSFTAHLIRLIARADPINRRRLALTFPAYVAAVDLAEGQPDGMARLRALARSGR